MGRTSLGTCLQFGLLGAFLGAVSARRQRAFGDANTFAVESYDDFKQRLAGSVG